MKQSRKVGVTLLIIGLILILLLFFADKIMTKPSSQVAGGTVNSSVSLSPTLAPPFGLPSAVIIHPTSIPSDYPTHVAETLAARPPTITPTPTATSTLAPPACTFPLAGTTAEESEPKEYTFSEPQVVMTDELQPDIIDWLPDNQNVLIMPLKLIDLGMNGYRQTIELFNPETKETHIYATRRKVEEAPPTWNPALNAIVYSDMNVLEGSTLKNFKFTRQVKISYGNPDDTQLLADNLPQYPMAVKSDGSQIAYFLDNQLIRLDRALKPLVPISFDRKRWDYLHENIDGAPVDYRMTWRPNSSQIFLYNLAQDNLGYTYILNTDTGRLCNLNFGGWALVIRWSPNGRYLAIIRAQSRVPLQSLDLAVLDTATGSLYTLELPKEIEGRHYLKDIAWASDNRHLFTIGSRDDYSGMLFLGDFISGQLEHILPSYKFKTVWEGTNLAWSPDGSKILMNCPNSEDSSQVCLISVQISGH